MLELDHKNVIKKIKNIAKWNLKKEKYIFDMYCDFPNTHFSVTELEALAKGKKRVPTQGRFYTTKNLEESSDKDLYELLIMIKQDEINIMKYINNKEVK